MNNLKITNSTIKSFSDHLGDSEKDIEFVLYDDCWRSMLPDSIYNDQSEIQWSGAWGVKDPYGHKPEERIKPLAFDVWGDPNTLTPVHPISYSASLSFESIRSGNIDGMEGRLLIKDTRDDSHPLDYVIAVPVGLKIPLKPATKAFGLKEMYLDPKILNMDITSTDFPSEWFYLEAELFGMVPRHPMDGIGTRKEQWNQRIHCGAPMAIFQEPEADYWWAFSGEPDYGAAIKWNTDSVLLYTTLYLAPGDTVDWKFCFWRQKEEYPENVYLQATKSQGFYNQMNPLGLEQKGVPEGPIVFININRPKRQLEELRKIKPKMVILNYIYDHISDVANMYDTWRTYEGFTLTETGLKELISEIKGMGAKVGYYGTSVEQPESHKPLQNSDIVMDKKGRCFNAWEPGNWVIDAGNGDCADRLAKAEAEFACYYGFECVFVDRLDHLSVNANPLRIGKIGDVRLKNVPSVRLGIIELNKKRVEWQRKLNPHLYIGLNNTTQWIGGVRYSDFNLLEGGMDLEPPIFYLNAPQGIVHKQHYNIFFCDVEGDVVDHGIIQKAEQKKGFDYKRRDLYLSALTDGVRPQPYEDEIFVARDSQFFKGWNDRNLPDTEKWAFYLDKEFYGGDSWNKDEEYIFEALKVANTYCFPVDRVWLKPDKIGDVRFSARKGTLGGYFIGVRNNADITRKISFSIDGLLCEGTLESGEVQVWYCENKTKPLQTLKFSHGNR
jgi:hypothetical protein